MKKRERKKQQQKKEEEKYFAEFQLPKNQYGTLLYAYSLHAGCRMTQKWPMIERQDIHSFKHDVESGVCHSSIVWKSWNIFHMFFLLFFGHSSFAYLVN